MPNSSGMEEDLRVALNGYFSLDVDVFESLEDLGMKVVPLLDYDAGRTRFPDCMIVGHHRRRTILLFRSRVVMNVWPGVSSAIPAFCTKMKTVDRSWTNFSPNT